ncbi:MAG: UDP-glucose/GDP-mannose dehydrogenase family protein [Planctomycetes bacterium]|nr:UDP-glucose/GDP-mannose dehydrogenase family protein [Planctomycetota bacterium]MCP4838108.1 UDP-glucose/GDP-mannose dehydrogenase family protein [Planctomycetota bacterium]
MHLTIVGSGYVGLVTGTCFANTGNQVTCLDINPDRVKMMLRGECPIFEPGLSELMTLNIKGGRLHFTGDKTEGYSDGELIFICVGTPTGADGRSDLSAVMAVAHDIGEAIESGACTVENPVVVVKSTVPVGTTAKVRDAIAAVTSKPFSVADNPEFLKEGDAIQDFQHPDRVVCGVESKRGRELLTKLYEPFVTQSNPLMFMDIESSEMVKYASNAMLAAKISFINEIARLAEHYGADIARVREGMCADKRIGDKFLFPGLGYGGSCFPKDTLAVIEMGQDSGIPCLLNEAVHEVNQQQRLWFLARVLKHFGEDLSGHTFAIWGLAFKPRTDDVREAPAQTIIEELLRRGAAIRAFDPIARKTFPQFGLDIDYVDDMYECLEGCNALVLCTEWDEFRTPDIDQMRARLSTPVIFDGRNVWHDDAMHDQGFAYYSVGRRPLHDTVEAG